MRSAWVAGLGRWIGGSGRPGRHFFYGPAAWPSHRSGISRLARHAAAWRVRATANGGSAHWTLPLRSCLEPSPPRRAAASCGGSTPRLRQNALCSVRTRPPSPDIASSCRLGNPAAPVRSRTLTHRPRTTAPRGPAFVNAPHWKQPMRSCLPAHIPSLRPAFRYVTFGHGAAVRRAPRR